MKHANEALQLTPQQPRPGAAGWSEVKLEKERNPLFRPVLAEKLVRDDDASSAILLPLSWADGQKVSVNSNIEAERPRLYRKGRSRRACIAAASLCAALLSALLAFAVGCSSGNSAKSESSEDSSSFSQLADASHSESASSESAGDTALSQQLLADIEPIAKASGMDVGVCAIDLTSGARATVNGDKPMVAASMIKLAVAASFLEQAEAGAYSLNDSYVIQDSDIVGGTGTLGAKGAGAEVTYDELLEKMISVSDNTAANILIEAVGMKEVNETAKALGLESTELNRLMMDEEAIARGVENYTSANDVAKVLELAYKGELVSKSASKTLVAALEAQQDVSGILDGLPAGTKFAHKTGSLAQAQHDGGIVSADRDFILVTLCGGSGFSLDGALETMADIGKVAYKDIVG